MAKSTIGRGQYRGKLGGDVFAVRDGQQIIRAYQPVVNNPKTSSQQIQRAKGNLIGRVSQIMPAAAIIGLNGTSKTARRSRFLQLALRNATAGYAAGSTTEIVSKLEPNDLILSEGALNPIVSVTSASAAASGMVVTLSTYAESTPLVPSSGVLLVAVFLGTDGIYESVSYLSTPAPEAATPSTVTIVHSREGGYTANLYIIPYSTIDGRSLATVTGELYGDDADYTAVLRNNPAALPLSFGRSQFVNSYTYTPA